MRSLLAPLVVGLVLSLVAVFGVQWSLVRVAIDGVMKSYIAGQLAQDADELFGSLSVSAGGKPSLALTHFDPPFISPLSGQYYQILLDDDVALKSPSLVYASLPLSPARPAERRVESVAGPEGQMLLLSANGYEFAGHSITVGVAVDLQPLRTQVAALLSRYTQVSLLMFAVLIALQIGIVRLALLPLRRVQADVGRLERGEIAQLGETVPKEVLPLVREINRLLPLLTHRLQRSRESLGNLAHALKAPLTVLTHIANDEQVRHSTLGAQLTEQLGILRGRIESELRRARVSGMRAPGVALDLKAELESLIATLRMLYRDRALDIACRVNETIRFRGDREDLLELCGNLLDNACKWARSRVLVTASDGNGIVMTVADDGPGCSPEGIEQIAQRGVRLDEATEGHGLGLAIAANIAFSYGGDIRYGRSQDLGGFEVTVSIPAAPSA